MSVAQSAPLPAAPSAAPPTAPPSAPPAEQVVAVADSFVDLMRAFVRIRTQFLADAVHNVEWTAHLVLKCVAAEGPLRSGAIAELLQSDPSTVSRQVAALVKDGLIERRADPADGRACLLALTPKADDVLKAHEQVRNAHFATMLADWSEDDLHTFAELLRRFTEVFATTRPAYLPGAPVIQAAPAEGNI